MQQSPLVAELDSAIDRGELILLFQPQVDLATERVVAVEALARWLHPELGLLMPYAFIPIAEDGGLIRRIGYFVAAESCAALAEWNSHGHDIGVAINVSPLQLTDGDFAKTLLASAETAEVDVASLTLEITESIPIDDATTANAALAPLRSAGATIAVDDYGIGYSSLARLDDLGARELKIDRSLLHSDTDSSSKHLSDVVAYAHERSIRVVAEGIETAEHKQRAIDLGCDRAQGYLYGRPMSQREISLRLAAERR